MFIIDSQVHIWAPETPEKPYAKENASKPHRALPLGHDELLREMDDAGVSRCILVPPTWEADRNDTSLEAARLHPDRFRVMGKVSLTNPNGRALMATWKQQPYMLGIRMVFNRGESAKWLNRRHRRLALARSRALRHSRDDAWRKAKCRSWARSPSAIPGCA